MAVPQARSTSFRRRKRNTCPAAARARADAVMRVQFPSITPQPREDRHKQRQSVTQFRSAHLRMARDLSFAGRTTQPLGRTKAFNSSLRMVRD